MYVLLKVESLPKGFSSIEVLFASVLVIASFVVVAGVFSQRSSDIVFKDGLSKKEETALVFSESLLKSCTSGLAFCSNGYVYYGVLTPRKVFLNSTGFAVKGLDGEVIFSQGFVSGFCVKRLALFEGEVVLLEACVNG